MALGTFVKSDSRARGIKNIQGMSPKIYFYDNADVEGHEGGRISRNRLINQFTVLVTRNIPRCEVRSVESFPWNHCKMINIPSVCSV